MSVRFKLSANFLGLRTTEKNEPKRYLQDWSLEFRSDRPVSLSCRARDQTHLLWISPFWQSQHFLMMAFFRLLATFRLDGRRHFGETYCFHLQPWRWREFVSLQGWRRKQYFSPKRWHLSASLNGTKTQNNNTILTPIRTSNLNRLCTWFRIARENTVPFVQQLHLHTHPIIWGIMENLSTTAPI